MAEVRDGDRFETSASGKLVLRYHDGTTVKINGKTKGTLSIAKDSSKEEVKQKVKNLDSFKRHIMGKNIKREVYVQNRLINYVL